MNNGNLGNVAALFLAFLTVPIGGCDSRAASPSGDEPTRYRVDAARHRVWLLSRDGVLVDDAAAPEKIAVSLPGHRTRSALSRRTGRNVRAALKFSQPC